MFFGEELRTLGTKLVGLWATFFGEEISLRGTFSLRAVRAVLLFINNIYILPVGIYVYKIKVYFELNVAQYVAHRP